MSKIKNELRILPIAKNTHRPRGSISGYRQTNSDILLFSIFRFSPENLIMLGRISHALNLIMLGSNSHALNLIMSFSNSHALNLIMSGNISHALNLIMSGSNSHALKYIVVGF